MKYRSLAALVALATAFLAIFSSCNKNEDTKPAYSVSSADWYTVSASGGKIEVNDISIEFPAGAFEKESKVAVTPVKKGSVKSAEGRELSEFYQLVFPKEGVNKPFTISINYADNPEGVGILEESPKWGRNFGPVSLRSAALWTSFSSGLASAEISGIDPVDSGQAFMTVGLAGDIYQFSAPGTKAAAAGTFNYIVNWIVPQDSVKKWEPFKKPITDIIDEEVKKSIKVYAKLGMEAPSYTLTVDVCPFDKIYDPKDPDNNGINNNWGQHCSDPYSKSCGVVEINTNKFLPMVRGGEPYDQDLLCQFQQTVIHETFHWLHEMVYDPRCAYFICKQGHNEWSMLSESFATWIEKYTGDFRISENCSQQFDETMKCFLNYEGKSSWQNIGYGLGFFTDWLAKNTSEKDLVKILEYQRANGSWKACPSLRAAYDSFLKEKKKEFFNPSTNWDKFMWDVIQKKVDNRIASASLGEYIKIDHVKQEINSSMDGAIDDIDVYNFSASTHRIVFDPKGLMFNKMTNNPALSLAFYQDNEKLKSWICDVNCNKLGYAVKGKPFAISGDNAKKKPFVYTERIEQDTEPVVLKNQLTTHIVPWPTFVEVEWGGKYGDNEYYSWSGDEVKVTCTSNGYFVECDYPGGSHLSFYIGWVNDRFKDVANVYFWQEYNNKNVVKVGKLKLNYSSPSSVEKDLSWLGKYKGDDFYLHCRLK